MQHSTKSNSPNSPVTFRRAVIGERRTDQQREGTEAGKKTDGEEREKVVVRVIGFSAGGADNVFEFGMVHAFLVSDAPRPHIVSGTSSGAVVAAMLADVLQAGEPDEDEVPDPNPDPNQDQLVRRRLAQVARFRSFLEQIQRLPSDFMDAALPDFTEVSARTGLVPLNLPTQQPREKEDRVKTALARYGLTRLLNGLLSSRVKVREMTRIVRLLLELRALGEWRWKWAHRCGRRARLVTVPLEGALHLALRVWTGFRIWLQCLLPVLRDAPLLSRCVLAPSREKFVDNPSRRRFLEFIGLARLRDAKRILFESWWLQLARAFLYLISYPLVALAWFFAPPALILWLGLNWVASRISILQRTCVLRVAGIFLLAVASAFAYAKHEAIFTSFAEMVETFARLTPRDLIGAISGWAQFRHGLWRIAGLVLAWFAPGLIGVVLAAIWGRPARSASLFATFLEGFGVKKDLLTTGVLHRLLMRAFDSAYFGKRNFNQALNEALGGAPSASVGDGAGDGPDHRHEGSRLLADWIWKKAGKDDVRVPKTDPILVAPVAADVADGEIVILEPGTPMVKALSAACALTPLFAALRQKVSSLGQGGPRERWLVDGSCVAREPIQPVLDLIKRLHLNRRFSDASPGEPRAFPDVELVADPSMIDFCVISPYPTRRLREQERLQIAADMSTLIPDTTTNGNAENDPVAKPLNQFDLPGTLYRLPKILALRATHAAKDERILVGLYNAALRPHQKATGQAFFCAASEPAKADKLGDWHVYANLRELEPSQPVQLMVQLSRCADDTAKRALLLRIISEGCRASLSGLFRNKLADLARSPEIQGKLGRATRMRAAGKTPEPMVPPCRRLQEELKARPLPGISGRKSPPGITEICKECAFHKNPEESWRDLLGDPTKTPSHAPMSDWGELRNLEARLTNIQSLVPKVDPPTCWPREKKKEARDQQADSPPQLFNGRDRPVVSVIFSGGVFRGVFQVGVLNAFCMAGVKPDLVAGASVGTIMAALGARVFSEKDDPEYPDRRRHRQQHRIAGVAATFLAIDRLVLTDRFADFIRRFTLRAGSADFSLRDADHLFRRFDRRTWELLARRSRQVLAGLHRLTYMDPLELLDLLSLYAPHKRGQLPDRFVLYAQDALNRAGIGTELLGSEPLEQLIKAHVLTKPESRGAGFGEFLDSGIQFMATATNLTTGELDVLGSFCNPQRSPALIPGLLASGAFPAVFRPRMNWELRAGTPGLPEELVDGGIADNLPIVPVYRFLFCAGHARWLKLRPRVGPAGEGEKSARPHLILTASLEPKKITLTGDVLDETAESWPALKERVGELKYNVSVDSHCDTQTDLRKIQAALEEKNLLANVEKDDLIELPDVHISCVKPEWLCHTFAFHPMLGFKRQRQAANIAHGCASTLLHLHREQESHPDWTSQWWNTLELHPEIWLEELWNRQKPGPEGRLNESIALHPRAPNDKGDCCFVKGYVCPFSRPSLEKSEEEAGKTSASGAGKALDPLEPETKAALHEIYLQCGMKKKNHRVG
jgi:predicted acylesterase/phospholipase RssA